MKLYHMSDTLKAGDVIQPGYKGNKQRCTECFNALEKGEEPLQALMANAKSSQKFPVTFQDWDEYVKWCVEGIFEFIRKNEFPQFPSRLACNYYFDQLEPFKILYQCGWAQEPVEEQEKIHLFEVELDDTSAYKCDMVLFDEAFDSMKECVDVHAVIGYARKYYGLQKTEHPIWEMISDQPARAVKDITDQLRKMISVV